MNTENRLVIRSAFIAALKYLSSTNDDTYGPVYKHEYICHAIERAAANGDITFDACAAARRIINSRLGYIKSYIQWLDIHHPEISHDVFNDRCDNSGRKAQSARRRWMKSLIAEFSAPAM